MRKLSKLIEEVMIPFAKSDGAIKLKIFLRWEEIVGKEIADIALPYKINFNYEHKSGILYLEIKNGAFAPQVQYLSDLIIEKIAIFLGYKLISDIKIKQCF